MATTLSYGYILPEDGDFGDVWFDALEDNITQLNSHNHNGTNSAPITSFGIQHTTASVLSGAFSLVGSEYRATVTLPTGLLLTQVHPLFRDPTTKNPVYLDIATLSATQFYVYTNFVQTYEVMYL